ncbi:tryptophan aminotransferase-related protein 2-like isoform X1 [Cucurbita pepo subsp. pepo]|uniref:tryptophan aminotransferase-related protein 2-like isoform X1 n=2 Tax=Cucurbita pepo subsp. pepo TaxID=3664 RepID=UPI000C9D75C8|nr:tryptophan aminotransferase-related protein 2-like isoform X1 [Cucurbita pepo subsp. pepo]
MGRVIKVISLKHFFVLSMALNVSLILRAINQDNRAPMAVQKGINAAQMTFLSFPLLSSPTAATPATQPLGQNGRERVINLDHGDPTMYEKYWKQMGDKATIVIPGWQSMSYFSDVKNLCWFLEPEFAKQIVRVHKVVGNALTEGRHIVVGTGSSQLFSAALYALAPQDASNPISVVSAAPYYSCYPLMTDSIKSGLHKWAGDAKVFNKDEPYIELVTSPNNPDGFIRHSMVNRTGGILVHDLAYYWPQYTPISSPADNDLTLFTVSKITGHAGMRIGWALVKDVEVAKKMTKFIELNTIGVSKDSQIRAAKVLEVVSDSCEQAGGSEHVESFFHFSHALMTERWRMLREAVKRSGIFSLPEFSSAHCNFFDNKLGSQPAFAWLKCDGDDVDDCESFLRRHKILTRGGKHFGVSPKYVRISMMDREETYDLFIQRLSQIRS